MLNLNKNKLNTFFKNRLRTVILSGLIATILLALFFLDVDHDFFPKYSNFSWFSCLFMAGIGIVLLFYSQEAIFHLNDNPYYERIGGDPDTVAYALTLHNWGIIPWTLNA